MAGGGAAQGIYFGQPVLAVNAEPPAGSCRGYINDPGNQLPRKRAEPRAIRHAGSVPAKRRIERVSCQVFGAGFGDQFRLMVVAEVVNVIVEAGDILGCAAVASDGPA